jgi:hypothetical protein
MARKQKRRVWMPPPTKIVPVPWPQELRAEVQQQAHEFVQRVLVPRHVPNTPPGEGSFISSLLTKWSTRGLLFLAILQRGDVNTNQEISSNTHRTFFARLEYDGHAENGEPLFTLSYHRYTGEWRPLYSRVSLQVCW